MRRPRVDGPPPNPAVAAFFLSTTWKLLIAADIAAVLLSVVLYILTRSIFALAPMVLVIMLVYVFILRAARRGAAPPGDGADPLVK